MRTQPTAVFMAFGTKGDVYPIAAIAAAFACDKVQYHVVFVSHSAHENLSEHLKTKRVSFVPVSSLPVLSPSGYNDTAGSVQLSFHLQKGKIRREHRKECLSIFEKILGDGPSLEGDVVIINFFALEGWSLAEVFNIKCVVAAPYVVPYSAPSSFERQFSEELAELYEYLQVAPTDKIGWKDVIHWMWPLFTEEWESWRTKDLKLSPLPFTDPVTGLPLWHYRPLSPMLLYGFSKEVVEYPEISVLISSGKLSAKHQLCSAHAELEYFLETRESQPLIFIGFSSVGSMGFLRKPQEFLHVLRSVLDITSYRFILFSAGYGPLDAAIQMIAEEALSCSKQAKVKQDGISLFGDRLFCFSGSIPYNWLFPRCVAAIHHGGSGSTAAALHAGIPQVMCPFMLDQFYWAERMFWLGVSPEPLKRSQLFPDENDDTRSIKEAASILATAINQALSSEVKARASEIAERLSSEDGVAEAVKNLKRIIS